MLRRHPAPSPRENRAGRGRAMAMALVLMLACTTPGLAQDRATLVADRIYISGNDRLVAEGTVEALYKGARLRAARMVYDQKTDRLDIEGPITLTDASGSTMIADSALLSSDLREGVLQSARVVLDGQLQIAANELARVSGRFTRMSKVVASSCQVCAGNPTPLWEIRARRVVHDQQERQLYFDNAQFRIAGVPVFYIPHLRMPDPTLDRATGFLVPSVRSTSALGVGLKMPYFFAIGDSRDLTLTPYVTTKDGRSLAGRYRQAFATGEIQFDGSLSHDRIRPDGTRGYLFGTGTFELPRDFRLSFGIELVSDPSYLLDYGITDKDRLLSGFSIERTRRNETFFAGLGNYNSLRTGEDNSVLPTLITDMTFHRRFRPEILGGQGGFTLQTHSHRRASTLAFDANGDGVADGRDMARLTARADWRRNWIGEGGLVVSGLLAATADVYAIGQDAAYPGSVTRVTPVTAVELRWPWMRSGKAGGATQIIEPIVQLVWAPDRNTNVPNEDSLLVELDEGNLFSLSRFPGADAVERGFRANVGVNWTRYDPDGWSFGVTAGRVLRTEDLGQFSDGSGLAGKMSDWIIASQITRGDRLSLTDRALFDDRFEFTKNELRVAYADPRLQAGASYIWMVADPTESRPEATSELAFDAGWEVRPGWRAMAEGRYDFTAERATRAGLGLGYSNECVTLDLSLSRRFTSSTSVQPTTDVDLSVVLNGFGTGKDGRSYRRACAR